MGTHLLGVIHEIEGMAFIEDLGRNLFVHRLGTKFWHDLVVSSNDLLLPHPVLRSSG